MSAFTFENIVVSHGSGTLRAPFDAFKQALESLAGRFEADVARDAAPADVYTTIEKMQGEEGLMIFGMQNHGALFVMKGQERKAIRYHIGNPLIAFSMTQHDIRAALYAPLTVLIYELDADTIAVEFDLPSTQFGQFGVPEIAEVGFQLDGKLQRLLNKAAAQANQPV